MSPFFLLSYLLTSFFRLEQVLLQLLIRVVFALIVIGVGALEPVYALTASVDVSIGYSDNVLASADKQGSGFSQYVVAADQTLSESRDRSFGLYFAGRYRDYFRFTNQWQATLGASSWNRLLDGQLHSYNYIEFSAFRDDLVPEDDCHIVNIGTQWRWFFNDQMSASFQVDYEGSYYRDEVEELQRLFRDGSGAGKNNNGITGDDVVADTQQRNDHQWRGLLRCKYLFSADLSSEFAVNADYHQSSVDSEEYDAIGVENSWQVLLANDLVLEFGASHSWREYDTLSERELNFNSGLTWQYSEPLVVYVRADKRWNDSPINQDNYTELVSECGLIWSF